LKGLESGEASVLGEEAGMAFRRITQEKARNFDNWAGTERTLRLEDS